MSNKEFKYAPPSDIPEEIHRAAGLIQEYFDTLGMQEWQFAGLADRRLVNSLARELDELRLNRLKQLKEVLGGAQSAGLTAKKVVDTESKELHNGSFRVSGFVLSNDAGDRCVVEMAAARWLSNEEMQSFMHAQGSETVDMFYNKSIYKWNELNNGYFNDSSCGAYGAVLKEKKWIPAWCPPDSVQTQLADESFDHPLDALARADTYFHNNDAKQKTILGFGRNFNPCLQRPGP